MSSSVTFVTERETVGMDQTKRDVVSFCEMLLLQSLINVKLLRRRAQSAGLNTAGEFSAIIKDVSL